MATQDPASPLKSTSGASTSSPTMGAAPIGPYRKAAVWAIIRRTFMKPAKSKRRKWWPGKFGSPSRRWPVLTAEEEMVEGAVEAQEWEKSMAAPEPCPPEGGW
ncbi:hypothetical protein PVAG01_09662 [Phlyctema vagabunda]|uniref:Uncharacterized protein n=1 Tax=Phlyctema vagabunda TaxID=108571 RepID=A0ABR4P7Z5_9HELO